MRHTQVDVNLFSAAASYFISAQRVSNKKAAQLFKLIVRSLAILSCLALGIIMLVGGVLSLIADEWATHADFALVTAGFTAYEVVRIVAALTEDTAAFLSDNIGPQKAYYRISITAGGLLLTATVLNFMIRSWHDRIRNRRKDDSLFENKVLSLLILCALFVLAPPLFTARFILDPHDNPASNSNKDRPKSTMPDTEFVLAYNSASPERGETFAGMCQSCHSFDITAKSMIGPPLYTVVGRPVASVPGYPYSNSLIRIGGEWTPERLNQFLSDTQAYAPGSTMYLKLANTQQRLDIIKFIEFLPEEERSQTVELLETNG